MVAMDIEIYGLVILPLLIFTARVIDVSLGTTRIIFISKGLKYYAPIVGFFEILIWLMAISQIFSHLTNVLYYLSYAGGYATGTFVGIKIEEKLSIGTEIVRFITRYDASKLISVLRKEGYSITVSNAEGPKGQVNVVYIVIDRHDLPHIVKLIKKYNPQAFYSIEDIRYVSEKISPRNINWMERHNIDFHRFARKGK
jgi:uncharacterized protein YebE (UPF0316 family)